MIVKGLKDRVETFCSEPRGRHFDLFSKEREAGNEIGRTMQPKYGVLLKRKYGPESASPLGSAASFYIKRKNEMAGINKPAKTKTITQVF